MDTFADAVRGTRRNGTPEGAKPGSLLWARRKIEEVKAGLRDDLGRAYSVEFTAAAEMLRDLWGDGTAKEHPRAASQAQGPPNDRRTSVGGLASPRRSPRGIPSRKKRPNRHIDGCELMPARFSRRRQFGEWGSLAWPTGVNSTDLLYRVCRLFAISYTRSKVRAVISFAAPMTTRLAQK
jgi:hypothetical protein